MAGQHQRVDGRRARGQQRQELLLATALDLVRQQGLPALTVRSLAAAAGVSLASITYHFPTRADLLQAACVEAMRQDLAALRKATDDFRAANDSRTIPIDDLADWILELSCDPRRPLMSMFSFYLEIVRQPELAPIATQWIEENRTIITEQLTEAGAPEPISSAALLHATLLGLRLPLLAETDPDPVRTYHDDITRLLHWILDR